MGNFFLKLSRIIANRKFKKNTSIEAPTVTTSIRLPEKTIAELDGYVQNVGITRSALMALIIEDSLHENDLQSLLYEKTKLIESRLWYLFNTHKLNYCDIISLINLEKKENNKELASICQLTEILKLVDQDFIENIADFFEVNPNWILSEESNLHKHGQIYNWYRRDEAIFNILKTCQDRSISAVYFIRNESASLEEVIKAPDNTPTVNVTIALYKNKTLPNGKSITIGVRHNVESWNYEKSRKDYKLLATAIHQAYYLSKRAFNHSFRIHSFSLETKKFNEYFKENDLSIVEILHSINDWNWYIEDYIDCHLGSYDSEPHYAIKESAEAKECTKKFNSKKRLLELFIEQGLAKNINEVQIP